MWGSSTYVEKVECLRIFEILTRLGIVKRSFTCFSMWKCGRCGHTVSVSFVEALVDSIEEELDLIANVGDFDKYLEVREQPTPIF